MQQYDKTETSSSDFMNLQKQWQKSIDDFERDSNKRMTQFQIDSEKKTKIKNAELTKV